MSEVSGRAWKRARYRPVEVKSGLRPDYYEFFPSFSDYELMFRFSRMGPLEACAFMIPNFRRAMELDLVERMTLVSILGDKASSAFQFSNYLQSTGFCKDVAELFKKIDRRRFIPEIFTGFEWVNESIPISCNTWISAVLCSKNTQILLKGFNILRSQRKGSKWLSLMFCPV